MDAKPGLKTTEFWVSLATALAGVGAMLGYFTPAESSTITQSVTTAIGGLMTTLSTVMYAFSRGKVKADNSTEVLTQVVAALSQITATLANKPAATDKPAE
jgi:hypothetical protein